MEFELITEEDKRHAAYFMCVLGVAGVGATFGSMAGGMTLPGALGGAVVGLLICKTVEQPLKRALFSSNGRMTQREFGSLVTQTGRTYPRMNRKQVLDLIAASKLAAKKEPQKYRC